MIMWEKLICVLIPLALGGVVFLVIWHNNNNLKKRTDNESKIKFEAQREDGVSDHNRRLTKSQGSLFATEQRETSDSFFSYYYKEKVDQVKKHG